MPNDLFRWEVCGALVHHCPWCHTPLTNKRSLHRCLGNHVECCPKYHTQLFKRGNSGVCMACRNSNELKDGRHRAIAELLRKLRDETEGPMIIAVHAVEENLDPKTPSPAKKHEKLEGSSKKDRKEAKKTAKAAERPRLVTARDIRKIGEILHPDAGDDEEFERALLAVGDRIESNLAYQGSVWNVREVRRVLIQQDRDGQGFEVQEQEMERILGEFKVPAKGKNRVEKDLIAAIRKAVQEDLVNVHSELQGTMMRKAGFWRWANAKAYNRLVERGRIWDWKNGEPLAQIEEAENREQPAEPMVEDDEGGQELAGETEQPLQAEDSDIDMATPVDSDTTQSTTASTANTSRHNSISSVSTQPSIDVEEEAGWTQIGKVKKPKQQGRRFKLRHNEGLAHLSVRTPRKSKVTAGLAAAGFATLSNRFATAYDPDEYMLDEDDVETPKANAFR